MPSRINPYTGEVVLTELPSGLAFAGRTNSDMTPSKTAVVCAQLAGYGDDYFNNHFYMQVIKAAHELLTIDGGPAPADFAAGATLTGATSLKTCIVVAKLTSTTYIVKSRSGAFTDGEVISDGTNSIDCGAGFPTFAAAAAPEHEVRKITDYVSLTGTFTVDTFTQVVGVLAEILVIHESLVSLGRDDADNVFDSSAVTKNRDGSVLERTEFIIDALLGTQFRTEQSKSGTVEENAFEMFNISLFDLDSGAIASASIDIAAITQTMEKSTGGADFASAGITQPTFLKADGRVYCSYQFLAAQWAVGDLYRLTVTGITAVVDTETVYCPTMVWSNAVLEAANIDTNVETILSELAGTAGVASFPGAANPGDGVSLAEVIRAILTSMVGGDDFDGYTNISNTANASLNAIAQKFAATLGIDATNTFSTTIHGANQATIEAAFDAVATYIVASGADFSKKVNNLTLRTNLEDIIQDICAVVGCDAANTFSVTSQGAERTTILAAFESLAAYLSDAGAGYSSTIDPGGTARTCVETAIEDVGKVLAGGGITTFPAPADIGTGVSLAAAIRAILTSMVGGDDFDGYTNINNSANASLNAIAQKFATVLGVDGINTFITAIHGENMTTVEAALSGIATYMVSGGGDYSKKVNNLTLRTNLEDIIQDICAVIGVDAANVWSTSISGATQTTVEATEQAIGTAIEKLYALDDRPAALAYPSSVVADSILAFILSKATNPVASSFDNTTDSLEMISDKAGGFSGDGGAAQDDSVKASLDLAHTDLDAILEDTANLDKGQLIVGNINILYPDVDQPAAAIEFTLHDANGGFITDGQITDVGQIDIYRYRKGTDAAWTQIVNAGAPAGTALGTLNYSYAFPNASWAAGDLAQVHVSSVGITKNGKVFTLPRVTAYTVVGMNQIIQDLVNGGRLDLLIDSIEADTKNLYDTSLGVAPADGSLASFIATGGTALGTRLPVNKSLYDGLSGGIDAVNRVAGKMQVKATTIDLAQIAGAYDLFTGTTQDVVVEKLTFRLPNVNVADDATITSIAIASNDATPQVLISSALGVKANLTAEAQISWTGAALLKAGKKIQLTIAGGTADAATVCDVVAEFRAVTGGGYLA